MATFGPGCWPETLTILDPPGAMLPPDGLIVTGGLVGPEADQVSVLPPLFVTVIGGYSPLRQKALGWALRLSFGGFAGGCVGCRGVVAVGRGTLVAVGCRVGCG